MLADIKYLFIGLLIGATIAIVLAILTRCMAMLYRRFPNSRLSKLSNLLSTKYEINIFPIFTAKHLPAWLSTLAVLAAALSSGVAVQGALLSTLTPFIFTIIGLVIGLFAAMSIFEIFKEIKNT